MKTNTFLLVGLKKVDKERIDNFIEENLLENILTIDSIDHKYIDALCKRSTLGLFSLDIRHTTHNIPGKFLQYLSTGLPVFGLSKQSDVVNLIKEKSLEVLIKEIVQMKPQRLLKKLFRMWNLKKSNL